MSKFRVDNPAGTPLDPYAFEKSIASPNLNNPSPFSAVADSLEFSTAAKVDDGYGTMGNSSYAIQAINEAKAANQGAGELLAKGVGNVIKTIGIEVAKTPGYIGGVVGAVGNEILGDGKQSMDYIVDNAWVNAFEKLDQATKEAMPIYTSKQVQEGGLMDKLGSGAWWAEAGADGLGFMLSMFVPGAIAKAAGIGGKIAKMGEVLGNLSPKLGKLGTAAGLLEGAGEGAYAFTKTFARNADGWASAVLNTTLESSAEAANTFDNLKDKYIQAGLSEDEAKLKAGEGAAAVFKGNMALLMVSNYLDESYIWKTIGSAGEKEAGQSILKRIFKDGAIDYDALAKLPKEFTTASVLKRTGINFGKGILKEGAFEEGAQTTLQQNVEKGKISKEGNFAERVGGDLLNVVTSYLDDFSNNTELHESIFLGGLLGGGASIFGTIQENNALKKAISGGEARTKDNSFWSKYGILPETNAQKGFAKIVAENHIAQFRTYKDLLEETDDGRLVLNEQKLADANLEQADILRTNILYDLAVAQGNKLGQEIFAQFLAANYVNGFLGQEGGKELFKDHVEKQVLPAWQKRFLDTFGTEATDKQSRDYADKFYKSGERIFKAHESAQETDYAERYYNEPSKEFLDFKKDYFHKKFQTLVALDSFKERERALREELSKAGLTDLDLEDLSSIKSQTAKVKAQQIKKDLAELEKNRDELDTKYGEFFTKEGVKKMFEAFKQKNENFNEIKDKLEKENEELKAKADLIPVQNEEILQTLKDQANNDTSVKFRSTNGKRYSIDELENFKGDINNLQLQFDDVSNEEFEEFVDKGTASDKTINKIADKIAKGETLSNREQAIAEAHGDKIDELLKSKKDEETKASSKEAGEIQSSESITDDVALDKAVTDEDEKKGVNLYPSTGRNLKDALVEVKPGMFVEQMTDSPAQKLWFETLDKEVNKNPTAYTVQIVKYGDRNLLSPELKVQIEREALRGSPKDSDTFVVLHKDGQPVAKGNNQKSIYDIEKERIDLISRESTAKEKFEFINSLPQGTIFTSDGDSRVIIGPKKILKSGTEEFELIVEIFNEEVNKWETSDVIPMSKKQTGEYSGKFPSPMLNNPKVDLNNGERIIVKPVITTPKSGNNNVFTALWRPENLYPTKDGKPSKFILAESAILQNYLLSIGKPKMKVDRLSKADKDLLKLNNVEPNLESIMTAAFFHAKQEYQEWYNGLQSGDHLAVANITKGHRTKVYKDSKGEQIAWNSAFKGIPGLTLTSTHLIGGKLQLSTKGVIKVDDQEYKIASGDVVMIDNQNNVHPIKVRNLNNDEVRTVLFLLSLRDTTGPTEAIKVNAPEGMTYGTQSLSKVPVFYDTKKPKMNLISSLISFGSNNGNKGEIYFNKESLSTNPLLVFTDFNGETHNLEVKKITEAFESNDFSKIDVLVKFLEQKRFNVNEILLGDGKVTTTFSKPKVTYEVDTTGKRTPKLSWDQSQSYLEHLLGDVMTTSTHTVPGYPNRVQRNLAFHKNPIQIENEVDTVEEVKSQEPIPVKATRTKREVKPLDSFDDMDKILTTSELLKAKIKSGEIIQNCK